MARLGKSFPKSARVAELLSRRHFLQALLTTSAGLLAGCAADSISSIATSTLSPTPTPSPSATPAATSVAPANLNDNSGDAIAHSECAVSPWDPDAQPNPDRYGQRNANANPDYCHTY